MAKSEFSKVRVLVKDVGTLEAGHPINYGKDVGHYALQIARWDDADGKQGIAKIEIRDNSPFGKGIALSAKEFRELARKMADALRDPEFEKLVIADYDAPKPVEKSEKAKALAAAEAEIAKLRAEIAERDAKQAEMDKRIAAVEALAAENVGVLA